MLLLILVAAMCIGCGMRSMDILLGCYNYYYKPFSKYN